MPRLPACTPRDLIRALERGGFVMHHQTGSHVILRHRTDPSRRVSVPFHRRDLKRGLMMGIIRDAGFTPEDFLEFL